MINQSFLLALQFAYILLGKTLKILFPERALGSGKNCPRFDLNLHKRKGEQKSGTCIPFGGQTALSSWHSTDTSLPVLDLSVVFVPRHWFELGY